MTISQDSPDPAIYSIVETANAQWNETFNCADAAGLAALYTTDARLLPPGSDAVLGTEAIRAFWQSVFDLGIRDHVIEVAEVHASGELAYETGTWRATLVAADGSTTPHRGNLIVVFARRPDGRWQAKVHSWN